MVGRRGADLDRELHTRSGAELVGVHPQPETRGAPASSTARDWSRSNAPSSQNTSIQRQTGAHAASMSVHTRST